jgi:hypothetical protein
MEVEGGPDIVVVPPPDIRALAILAALPASGDPERAKGRTSVRKKSTTSPAIQIGDVVINKAITNGLNARTKGIQTTSVK